jgi:hypothetical protein
MQTPRLFIYPSDLMRLSGKGEKACRRLLLKIKQHFGLEKSQELTYYHVSEYLKIPAEKLFPYLRLIIILFWSVRNISPY